MNINRYALREERKIQKTISKMVSNGTYRCHCHRHVQ